MVEFTPWAEEVLVRAHQAATRLNPDARLRLSSRAGVLESTLAEQPADGDREAHPGGITVFVASEVDGVVDIEAPHDRLVLKPPGASPNPRP